MRPVSPTPEEKKRQEMFRRMTENLRSTILTKDKDFLQELIDSPTLLKKKLMAKLIQERHMQVIYYQILLEFKHAQMTYLFFFFRSVQS